ncbi:hypothetical protein KIPB_005528, partial [Kipferlia bialata]
ATEIATGRRVAAKFQWICGTPAVPNWVAEDELSEDAYEAFMKTAAGAAYVQRQKDLKTEIRAAILLRDTETPHVVKYLRHFRNTEEANQMVIIMELVEGKHLQEHIGVHLMRSKENPLPHMLTIMHQLLLALSAMAKAKVIHRDIKPENIMIDMSGSYVCVKIVDFGLSKLMSEENPQTNSLGVGNIMYRAPECFENGVDLGTNSAGARLIGEYDQSADVWSLGLIFSEMLSRHWVLSDLIRRNSPGGYFNHFSFTHGLVAEDAQFNTVSSEDTDIPGLPDLINSMLQRTPCDRPSVDRLVHTLEGVIEKYISAKMSSTWASILQREEGYRNVIGGVSPALSSLSTDVTDRPVPSLGTLRESMAVSRVPSLPKTEHTEAWWKSIVDSCASDPSQSTLSFTGTDNKLGSTGFVSMYKYVSSLCEPTEGAGEAEGKSFKHVTSVDLAGHDLSHTGSRLARLLKHMPNVQSLDLRGNGLSEMIINNMVEELTKSGRQLREIILNDNGELPSSNRPCPQDQTGTYVTSLLASSCDTLL